MVGRTGLTDQQQAALYYSRKRRRSSLAPTITISNLRIDEDASMTDVVGALTTINKPDDWGDDAYTIVSDEDDKVDIDGANVILDGALDFETKTTHRFRVRNTPTGPYDPIERTFDLRVLNIIEAPVNLVAPAVIGVPQVGEVIQCSTGTWTDMELGSYAYQWKDAADDSDITGATSATLAVTAELVGISAYCTVTATNSADSTAEDSNTVGPFDFAPGYGAEDGFLILNDGAISGLHLGMI